MRILKASPGSPLCPTRLQLASITCLAAVFAALPAYAASAEGDAPSLIDKLHEKKILTDQEREELQRRESNVDKLLRALAGLSIGTLTYVDYSGGEWGGESRNRFSITRGYINVKRTLTPWLGFRVTPDVHLDETGDYKLRLKYLFAEFRPPNLAFLTEMVSETGIGHMPWLDFEEHVNPYRAQGTMFIERAGVFNSADVGIGIGGNFGGQLDRGYQDAVSRYYAGRWGSWHFGVYNGGGYHADENNNNKVPELRLTVRPLPSAIPGLQFSYFGLRGKGNNKSVGRYPDYAVDLAMVSYQDEWVVLTGQYARARGNNKGSLVVPGTHRALREAGYSFFFNTRLPVCDRKFNALARYDRFDPDVKDRVTDGNDAYDLALGGLAWEFYSHWLAMLVYERTMYEPNNGGLGKVPGPGKNLEDDWKVQAVLQIEF